MCRLLLPIDHCRPWLAPLAGFSDLPFRLLCREYGAAVCVTEMVSAKGLVFASPGTENLLVQAPQDQPLVVQLFGAEAPFLAKAVAMLQARGFLWFDLNMGCSVHKVLRQGAGAAMLDDLDNALDVARAMLEVAGANMVGFKLRLCPDEGKRPFSKLKEFALRLQDMGAGWLTLHPRTAKQGFGGKADWDALRELARCLNIPLLASGDLIDAWAGLRCLEQTGVSGLMYARGALRNPAVFGEHLKLCRGESFPTQDAGALRSLINRHIALIREFGQESAYLWKMRSVIPLYLRGSPGVRTLRDRLCHSADWQAVAEALEDFWSTGQTCEQA